MRKKKDTIIKVRVDNLSNKKAVKVMDYYTEIFRLIVNGAKTIKIDHKKLEVNK
jgi:hypothetical protein